MTVVFYLMFAFVQGVLSSKEQKPGLRVSMGLGIIFCITEVQMLQDVKAVIIDGKPADPRLTQLSRIFPKSYCTFEQVMMLRILFFLVFGLINSFSLCFVVSEYDQQRVLIRRVNKRQRKISLLLEQCWRLTSDDVTKYDVRPELRKPHYKQPYELSMEQIRENLVELKKKYAPKPLVSGRNLKWILRKCMQVILLYGILSHMVWPWVQ